MGTFYSRIKVNFHILLLIFLYFKENFWCRTFTSNGINYNMGTLLTWRIRVLVRLKNCKTKEKTCQKDVRILEVCFVFTDVDVLLQHLFYINSCLESAEEQSSRVTLKNISAKFKEGITIPKKCLVHSHQALQGNETGSRSCEVWGLSWVTVFALTGVYTVSCTNNTAFISE